MLTRIFSIIFPVFAVVLVGYLYGRYRRTDITFANRLNMELFVPALVFVALANRSFNLATYQHLAIGGVAVVLGSGLLAWPMAKWLNVDAKTFVPPMMFNNSGNMGLPLAVLAFGDVALAAAVVLFLVEMVLHFSLGAYMLNHKMRLISMLRIPVIMATLAGLFVSFTGWYLPEVVNQPIKMLADITIPLMLFALGVRLNEVSLQDWRIGLWGAVVSPLSGLIMVWLIGSRLGLDSMQYGLLVIFGALPPAVLNYLVAEQYRQEPEKVASIVMLGNLGSLVAIPLALLIALPG